MSKPECTNAIYASPDALTAVEAPAARSFAGRQRYLAAGALLLAGLLSQPLARADVNETETHEFELETGGRISLDNVNGGIRIEGGDGNLVRVVAHKKANNQEALDDIEIIIDARSDEIRIETRLPESGSWWRGGSNSGARVSYELSVPADSNLDGIESVNGDVDIRGVYGAVKVETVNGSIDVDGLSADTELETVNGSITGRFTSLTGEQKVDCESVNGRIALELPPNIDARFSAETVNGGIDGSDFGLETDKGFVGRDMNGEVGDGTARVNLSTVNGGIKVRKR
jgi:hypothetical protein